MPHITLVQAVGPKPLPLHTNVVAQDPRIVAVVTHLLVVVKMDVCAVVLQSRGLAVVGAVSLVRLITRIIHYPAK